MVPLRFDSSLMTPNRKGRPYFNIFQTKLAYSTAFSNEMDGEPESKNNWLLMVAVSFFVLKLFCLIVFFSALVVFNSFCFSALA